MIIIYKIYQSISNILSQPYYAKGLFFDYDEFVNTIKYEYSKSTPDEMGYNPEYVESEESFKKESNEKSYKKLVLNLKKRLHYVQEKNRLKEFNYLTKLSQLMNVNKELEKDMHTFYALNQKSLSTTTVNNWKTHRNTMNNKVNNNSVPELGISKFINKTKQSQLIENQTSHFINKSFNSVYLSSRRQGKRIRKENVLKTPRTLICEINKINNNNTSDFRKFK